jgi:hypothetical protein
VRIYRQRFPPKKKYRHFGELSRKKKSLVCTTHMECSAAPIPFSSHWKLVLNAVENNGKLAKSMEQEEPPGKAGLTKSIQTWDVSQTTDHLPF